MGEINEQHCFQWPHKNNFVSEICKILESCKNDEERMQILDTQAFATEKLDGSNFAKDDGNQLYARRQTVSKDAKTFAKVSLDRIREADIETLKKKICDTLEIIHSLIQKFVVYGELIVNQKYDYKKRNLRATWNVFGALLVIDPLEFEKIFQKLREKHFTFEVDDKGIWILSNPVFFNLLEECGLDFPTVKANEMSLYDIVMDHKESMERGLLEGIMVTFKIDGEEGHKMLKWKGAQDDQPNAKKGITKVIDDMKNRKPNEKLSNFLHALYKVAFAESDMNPLVKTRKVKPNEQPKGKPEKNVNSFLDKEDKKLISHGVFNSLKKFDDVSTFIHNDDDREENIAKYVEMIADEVRRHFIEEKNLEPDACANNFIRSTVTSIVKGKIEIKDRQ